MKGNPEDRDAWGEMGTGGSRGIRTSHDYVRRGGAVARIMLMQAAANEWQVPVTELTVSDSIITYCAIFIARHINFTSQGTFGSKTARARQFHFAFCQTIHHNI